jgi:hypothetical protein
LKKSRRGRNFAGEGWAPPGFDSLKVRWGGLSVRLVRLLYFGDPHCWVMSCTGWNDHYQYVRCRRGTYLSSKLAEFIKYNTYLISCSSLWAQNFVKSCDHVKNLLCGRVNKSRGRFNKSLFFFNWLCPKFGIEALRPHRLTLLHCIVYGV